MYLYCKVGDNSGITQPVKAAGTIASYLLIAEITAIIWSGVIPFSNSIACSSLDSALSASSYVQTGHTILLTLSPAHRKNPLTPILLCAGGCGVWGGYEKR